MVKRLGSILRGPGGTWLAMLFVASIAAMEAVAHGWLAGGSVPWWHLGIGVALVLWGGARFVVPVAAGATLGLASVFVAMSLPLEEAPVVTMHVAAIAIKGTLEGVGLALMLLVMGPDRRPIIEGRVDLPQAMRFILLGVPAVLLPAMLLQAGVGLAMAMPSIDLAARLVGDGLTGVLTAAPLMIAVLPSNEDRLTYRCHCNRPLIPLIAMTLLAAIGLLPLLMGTPNSGLMPLVSVLAMGVLGWLALASGWLATSMGILVLMSSIWLGEPSRVVDLSMAPSTNLLMLSPAFLIALLFAASMEARFRDLAGIAERHDELQTILGATGAALLRTDLEGRVTFANDAARHLCSFAESRLGEPLWHWVGRQAAFRIDSRLGDGRSETEITIENTGELSKHHVVTSPLNGEGGELHGHTIAIVDMNRRWQRESARREEQKRQYRTLANAYVHEVNTLAMAVGGAAAMAREESDDSVLGHLVGTLEQSCETAQQKADQLRLLSRRSSNASPIDLGDLVRSRLLLAAGQDRIDLGPMQLEVDDEVRLEEDFGRFIVDEFIQNAVDATRTGRPVVTGSIRQKGLGNRRTVVLELADEGPGIPDSIRKTIARPFVSTKGDGRGLGLAAIRTGVRHAGGRMKIQSSNAGTKLRITLPVAPVERWSTPMRAPFDRIHPDSMAGA